MKRSSSKKIKGSYEWILSTIFIFYFGGKALIWLEGVWDNNTFFPWERIEPNYPSFDSALKACIEANKRTLNNERVKELFNKRSNRESSFLVTYDFSFERTLLSKQCKVIATKDPNIGRMEGSFSFLEKKYKDPHNVRMEGGRGSIEKNPDESNKYLIATPTIVTKSNSRLEEDVYFPYKESWEKREKFIYGYTKN